MIEKLGAVEARFCELEQTLCDPAVTSDPAAFAALMKERKKLEPVVTCFRAYKAAQTALDDAKALLDSESDKELRALAQADLTQAVLRCMVHTREYVGSKGESFSALTEEAIRDLQNRQAKGV